MPIRGRYSPFDLTAFNQRLDHGLLLGNSDDDHSQYIKESEFTQDSGVLVGTGAGAFTEETGATLRTSLGLAIGTNVQAFDAVLDDISALPVVVDNEFIVGTGAGAYAHESGATARTSLGLGTGDSPTFTGVSLGTGELTTGSINRASGTLTLEIGGTAELSITSTETTFGGNLVIPDGGYIGSVSDTDAIQIEADGDVVLSQRLGIGVTPSQALDLIGSLELENTTSSTTGVIYKGADRFIHNFSHPTGGGAVPVGRNTFIGGQVGNFTMGSGATQVYHASDNLAMGYRAFYSNTLGFQNLAIGYKTIHSNTTGCCNAAMGYGAGYYNQTGNYNVMMGHRAGGYGAGSVNSFNRDTFIGTLSGYKITTGSDNVFLGYKSGNNQTTNSNLLIIDNQDRGSVANEQTKALIYGLFDDNPANQILTFNAKVGIGETAPETLLEMTDAQPYLTLHNDTHEDSDGGRESRLIFKGEQSGGEEAILAQIQASHDGTADDTKGDLIFSTHTGSALTEALRLDSSQNATFAAALFVPDGSDGAPSYSFIMDTTSGMYWDDDDVVLNFAIEGSRAFYVESTSIAIKDGSSSNFGRIRFFGVAMTSNRLLTLDLNNAARTIDLTGNPTLADWFDQSVKTTATPDFAAIKIKERAAAVGNTAAYGQLWVKTATPCELWYADDAGLESSILTSPYCHVRKNTSQAISTGADTALTFGSSDTEESDLLGFHHPTTNNTRFTVPAGGAGLYQVSAVVTFASNATGQRGIFIRKNGATTGVNAFIYYAFQNANGGARLTTMTISTIIDLADTDYIELWAFQDSGGNLDVVSIAIDDELPTELRMVRISIAAQAA